MKRYRTEEGILNKKQTDKARCTAQVFDRSNLGLYQGDTRRTATDIICRVSSPS